MEAYENDGHAYHATMPTDSLRRFRYIMKETEEYGFEKVRAGQQELGDKVRAMLTEKGFKSVASEGFSSSRSCSQLHHRQRLFKPEKNFAELGFQIAAGVPLQCDEPEDYQSFRLGLFGLDKLHNIERTVEKLEKALSAID